MSSNPSSANPDAFNKEAKAFYEKYKDVVDSMNKCMSYNPSTESEWLCHAERNEYALAIAHSLCKTHFDAARGCQEEYGEDWASKGRCQELNQTFIQCTEEASIRLFFYEKEMKEKK